MHHGHRQRQTLAHAHWQALGQAVQRVGEVKARHHLVHAAGNLAFRHIEQARVQHQVLPHGQFAIQREGLRHIADATARVDVLRVDFLAEQPRLAFAGGQQARQHFHRRGFAAAVGPQEAEDFAATDAKVHVVHGHEVAEAHGQVAGFDGDFSLVVDGQRHDFHRLVAAALGLGQQRDEGGFQAVCAGALGQRYRGAGGQYPALVHGDQPVEALRLVHVGGGDDHAHARAFAPYLVDQVPELRTRQRIHAGRRFVQDQQVGVMDQRAAQAQFLLHAPRQLAGWARQECRHAGAARQAVDAPPPFLPRPCGM
ncbi:hypothetical protein G6F68_010884 [Rhizopus microsporus]|nr:hypothetical protein G6F68_010884 [Rhizopus microsporus]